MELHEDFDFGQLVAQQIISEIRSRGTSIKLDEHNYHKFIFEGNELSSEMKDILSYHTIEVKSYLINEAWRKV